MYKTMTIWEMQNDFNSHGRENYFSDEGLEAIDNYYTEVEFDVVAICCDWNEYGDGVVLGFDDFISDFGYLIDNEEVEELEEKEKKEKIDAIFETLEDKTYCIELENGNILVMTF